MARQDSALEYRQIYRLKFKTDVRIEFSDPENGRFWFFMMKKEVVEGESIAEV